MGGTFDMYEGTKAISELFYTNIEEEADVPKFTYKDTFDFIPQIDKNLTKLQK